MNARHAYILLNSVPGIGPVTVKKLCDALGSPERIFEASASRLSAIPGVGPKAVDAILSHPSEFSPEREEAGAAGLGARIVTPLDDGYPEALRTLHNPPLALYVRGEWKPSDVHALAVVGTRHMSAYGHAQADRLSFEAAKAGFTIVSGLARGIDTVAHRAALRAGGRTVAVIGSSLDKLYPPDNGPLADEIAGGAGAVISEFPLGTPPTRSTFPYRNRLVAALSKGVLVVEAGLQSGALNTADQALDMGRSVMAIPGRIDMEGAQGPNRLIQNGARLVQGISDILKEFEFLFSAPERARIEQKIDARASMPMTPEETAVVRALCKEPELDIDTLVRKLNLPAARFLILAMQLEMKRIVRRLPGRRLALVEEVRRWAEALPDNN